MKIIQIEVVQGYTSNDATPVTYNPVILGLGDDGEVYARDGKKWNPV